MAIDMDRQRLVQAFLSVPGAFLKGDFTLASGQKSTYYVDAKKVLLHPDGVQAWLMCAWPVLRALPHWPDALAGPTSGADPALCSLVTWFSNPACRHLCAGRRPAGLLVRRQAKDHGTRKLVEGPDLAAGSRVVLVEDVASTGGSLIQCLEAVGRERPGVVVESALVVVDRQMGARELLAVHGVRLHALLTAGDLLSALEEQPCPTPPASPASTSPASS